MLFPSLWMISPSPHCVLWCSQNPKNTKGWRRNYSKEDNRITRELTEWIQENRSSGITGTRQQPYNTVQGEQVKPSSNSSHTQLHCCGLVVSILAGYSKELRFKLSRFQVYVEVLIFFLQWLMWKLTHHFCFIFQGGGCEVTICQRWRGYVHSAKEKWRVSR